MAQTSAKSVANGDVQDYTPAAAKTAGDIVVVGNRALPLYVSLAANELGALALEGIFDVPKETGAIAQGAEVYWQTDGTPVTGDASSGAATTGDGGGTAFLGYATVAAVSGDSYVRVRLAEAPTGRLVTATVAAAGSAQGDAGAIPAGATFVLATGADATKGVILPALAAGQMCVVKNVDNAVLKVYPASGGTINVLSANAAISMAARTIATFIGASATQVYTLPLLPS
jgi:predicted RecA/RadA family phage recombinase